MGKGLKIYIAGNPMIEQDNLAHRIKAKLQDIEVIDIDEISTMLEINENSIILDVCEGIQYVRLIKDIDRFLQDKKVSAHDMDLGFFIKLRKELGDIKQLWFICIPKQPYENLINEVQHCIEQVRKLL